jgi:hypothetical protein
VDGRRAYFNIEQLIDLTAVYAVTHPNYGSKLFSAVAIEALRAAFPCPVRQ